MARRVFVSPEPHPNDLQETVYYLRNWKYHTILAATLDEDWAYRLEAWYNRPWWKWRDPKPVREV